MSRTPSQWAVDTPPRFRRYRLVQQLGRHQHRILDSAVRPFARQLLHAVLAELKLQRQAGLLNGVVHRQNLEGGPA
jgi:hypothetical protein